MGGFSLWHWLIVGIVILLLFGKGRFSSMMGDVAQGLKSFKKGMTDDDEPAAAATPQQRLEASRLEANRPPERVGERPIDATPVRAPEPEPRREQ